MKILFAAGSLLFVFLFGCSPDAAPPGETKRVEETNPSELIVVSTGDLHAELDRAEGLASTIRDLRKRYGNQMIYLDAGDQFQGSYEGSIGKGRAVIEFFNLLKPDASVIGNHEFDFGPDVSSRVTVKHGDDGMGNLKKRVEEANFPMLSANLIEDPVVACNPGPLCNALGQKTIFEPRAVIQRSAGKVGVIGVTTPLTRNITSPAFFEGTRFLDLKPVILAESARLRKEEHCNWVLLLAHEGLRYEHDGKTLKDSGLLPILSRLPRSAVDAVIGGHSHTPMQTEIHKIPVMQSGLGGEKVGVLRLARTDSGVTSRFEPWIAVPDTAVAFDVTDQLMLYRTESLKFKRKIAGTTVAPFLFNKSRENALGNMVADALRDAAPGGADFALVNAGAIRDNLPSGRISNESVFRLMPFDDTLAVVELTGNEIRTLLEIACSGSLGLCSVSGFRITLRDPASVPADELDRDLNGDGKKEEWERNLITDVKDSRGRSLDPQHMYRVATISYLVEGGDFQDFLFDRVPPERIHYVEERMIRDILAGYLEKHSPLNPSRFYSPAHPRILSQP